MGDALKYNPKILDKCVTKWFVLPIESRFLQWKLDPLSNESWVPLRVDTILSLKWHMACSLQIHPWSNPNEWPCSHWQCLRTQRWKPWNSSHLLQGTLSCTEYNWKHFCPLSWHSFRGESSMGAISLIFSKCHWMGSF
jgi:hypothetical protein